jgi:hypothetical protein
MAQPKRPTAILQNVVLFSWYLGSRMAEAIQKHQDEDKAHEEQQETRSPMSCQDEEWGDRNDGQKHSPGKVAPP